MKMSSYHVHMKKSELLPHCSYAISITFGSQNYVNCANNVVGRDGHRPAYKCNWMQ